MFSVPTTTENPTDNQTENINPTSGKTEQSKRKEAAKNDIKTDTMTIRPTLLTEETRTKVILSNSYHVAYMIYILMIDINKD